jgi:hypothetical protein
MQNERSEAAGSDRRDESVMGPPPTSGKAFEEGLSDPNEGPRELFAVRAVQRDINNY